MSNVVEVYFKLSGGINFDPQVVSDNTGVQFSESYIKGSKNKKAMIPRSSAWILSSGKKKGDEIDVYDLSKKIITQLASSEEEIIELIAAQNLESRLQVVIWISLNEEVSTPAIGFDSDVIKFLGKIGASIDIDSYRNWEDE